MTIRFSQYLDNLDKKTLYVHRPLLNANQLIEWAKSNGCKTCLKPESMHVTLLYSKTPLIWPQPKIDMVTVTNYVSEVKQFDGGALVLHFEWEPFTKRHTQLIAAGGTSDYPEYKSHITLTYESEGLDPKSFGKYNGDLIFGPEEFREIDLEKKWKTANLEEAKTAHGYTFQVLPNTPDGIHTIKAFANGQEIGTAQIWNRDVETQDEIHFAHRPKNVHVDKAHRRRGVASRMYDKYEEYTGMPVMPSRSQTDDAIAFWADRTHRQKTPND